MNSRGLPSERQEEGKKLEEASPNLGQGIGKAMGTVPRAHNEGCLVLAHIFGGPKERQPKAASVSRDMQGDKTKNYRVFEMEQPRTKPPVLAIRSLVQSQLVRHGSMNPKSAPLNRIPQLVQISIEALYSMNFVTTPSFPRSVLRTFVLLNLALGCQVTSVSDESRLNVVGHTLQMSLARATYLGF